MIPTFTYPGMKGTIRPWLVSHFPTDIRCYVEPFAGRANVFFYVAAYREIKSYWLNDFRTGPWMQALVDADPFKIPDEITEADARVWKARARDGDPLAIVMEPWLTFYGVGYERVAGAGGGSLTKNSFPKKSMVERIHYAKLALANTPGLITGEKCEQMRLEERCDERDFVYFDPPYVGRRALSYTDADVDHVALLCKLKAAPYRWVLSDYPNPLHEAYLGPPDDVSEPRRKIIPSSSGPEGEAVWCSK